MQSFRLKLSSYICFILFATLEISEYILYKGPHLEARVGSIPARKQVHNGDLHVEVRGASFHDLRKKLCM